MADPLDVCEHYTPGPVRYGGGRPRPGDPTFCLAPAVADTEPGRCTRHVGTVTGMDRAELAEIEADRTWAVRTMVPVGERTDS